MRVYSRAALIAAAIGLGNHLLITGNFLGGRASVEELWSVLLTFLFVAPCLLVLAAAFTSNDAFRPAALTAASVSFFVPSLLLVGFYGIGLLYVPGVTAVLAATIWDYAKTRRRLVTSLCTLLGAVSGALLLMAYWPIIQAYDSCGTRRVFGIGPDGIEITGCGGTISLPHVAAGFGIFGAALGLLLIAAVLLGRSPPPSAVSAEPLAAAA